MTVGCEILRGQSLDDRVRLGVPNQGRLAEDARRALGWEEWSAGTRVLRFDRAHATVYLARSTDLPRLVAAGLLDGCLTGQDYVTEAGAEERLVTIADLGVQRSSICVVERDDENGVDLGKGQAILVSQYPETARRWARQQGPDRRVRVVAIDGAAEMYVSSGMADLGIDAVMTGETLRANGMRIREKLFESSGRVYASLDLAENPIRLKAFSDFVDCLGDGR
jgi:ATP phosphoribosyltransferase